MLFDTRPYLEASKIKKKGKWKKKVTKHDFLKWNESKEESDEASINDILGLKEQSVPTAMGKTTRFLR